MTTSTATISATFGPTQTDALNACGSATTAELIAFFNTNTGGAQVTKFSDRKTAERRLSKIMIAN